MNWLQIRLFSPYFSSFSTNSYGYYSQISQNLFSNGQIFASAQIVRQAARRDSYQREVIMGRRVGYAWVSTVGQKLDVQKLDV
jgi:hypothetical protein